MKMEIYQEAFQWQILLDEDSQRYDLVIRTRMTRTAWVKYEISRHPLDNGP